MLKLLKFVGAFKLFKFLTAGSTEEGDVEGLGDVEAAAEPRGTPALLKTAAAPDEDDDEVSARRACWPCRAGPRDTTTNEGVEMPGTTTLNPAVEGQVGLV